LWKAAAPKSLPWPCAAPSKALKRNPDYIPQGLTLLPNTSGARNAREAVRIARLAREMNCGDFVKVEVINDSKYLLPDNYETIKATEILAREGFIVLPYMYPDLNAPEPGQRRSGGGHALGGAHRQQQRVKYQRLYSNPGE
jgi:hypothetical protein